jgi:hypothetical protein
MGRAQSSNTRARARAQSSNTRARARAHHTRTTEVAIGDAFELEPLLERVYALTEPTILDSQAHGPRHWRDVARIGLTLASLTPKADSVVVFTFALLHDSQRHNEERDREHGARAAVVANALARERVLTLTPAQLQLLLTACSSHTNAGVVTDPTLGCCQDADRLTLWRVDITPKVNYLSTAAARQSESLRRSRALVDGDDCSWATIFDAYRRANS